MDSACIGVETGWSNAVEKSRLGMLDCIRGITLISMILYHAVWDLVYIFEMDWPWFQSAFAVVWQQSICWTFILLSGFCWRLGKAPMKRGVQVWMAGALISMVTLVFVPEQRILFGILTLLGSCMLLMIPLRTWLERISSIWGLIVSLFLFALTKTISDGTIGLGSWTLMEVPNSLYHGWFSTFLGFPMEEFFSTDYFPIFPWCFLFLAGYFLNRLYEAYSNHRALVAALNQPIIKAGIKPLNVIGRHTLPGYLVHQPILFLCLTLLYELFLC